MMKIVMLLRQKYWRNNMTTSKTVTQIQAKPICLSNVDSFFFFTSSVLVFSCLMEVASLSALTFVVSAYHRLFILLLVEITFYMTVSQ